MKYSIKIYYGALVSTNEKDNVLYSMCSTFTDNSILPTQEWFDNLEGLFINKIVNQIEQDGFNPDNFWYDYITEKQYENSLETTNGEIIAKW